MDGLCIIIYHKNVVLLKTNVPKSFSLNEFNRDLICFAFSFPFFLTSSETVCKYLANSFALTTGSCHSGSRTTAFFHPSSAREYCSPYLQIPKISKFHSTNINFWGCLKTHTCKLVLYCNEDQDYKTRLHQPFLLVNMHSKIMSKSEIRNSIKNKLLAKECVSFSFHALGFCSLAKNIARYAFPSMYHDVPSFVSISTASFACSTL